MAQILSSAVVFCILLSAVYSQSNICYEKADVLFIMDASGSIDPANFQKQLQFAATFINSFKVGITQFSVLRFDTNADLLIDFDDYKDNAALKNAILKIDYPGGGTDTASALKLAREVAFTSSRGARKGVPKIAIVSTDGMSFNPNDTAAEAEDLKNSNVLVLSIGVGKQVNKLELQTIATYADDVFEVEDYSQLVSIVYDYSELVCQIVQQFKCSNQADIFFFLDASNGIPEQTSFNNELLFVSNISSKVDLSNVHIGAATFGGSDVQKIFNLGQYTQLYDITHVLTSAKFLGGVTDTDSALKSVNGQKLFDPASGGRADAAKIVIILTDGGSVSAASAKLTAAQLRLTGINIIAVGVFKPNISELQTLVGHTVLDIVTNLANPAVAIDRIQTLTALQECSLPTTSIRNVSQYCKQYSLVNGIHPHPYDCTKYIECTFLRTSIMNCTTPLVHLIYNPAFQTCDYPGHVNPNPCNPFNSHVTPPAGQVTTPTPTAKPCQRGLLDVLFILDSSDNVSRSDFWEELRTATNLAEYFNISSSSVQFAGLSFGTNPKHLFSFNDFDEYKPLEEAILNAKYEGGNSNTYLALEDALNFISSGAGSRPSAPKLVILFSSGKSTDSQRTRQAATALKNAGVHIICDGYSNPDQDELKAIASTSGEVFVNNFRGLLKSVISYSNTTCNIEDEWICRGIQFSDVIFVVDSSASISSDDYKGLLSFVIDVTSKFTISVDDIRFGAIIFSQDVSKLFDLKDFTSHASMSSALLSAAHLNGGTETAKALNFVREQQMFSTTNGGRENATKIIIILTDGRSNSMNDTITAAQRLKATGVKFIAVGIGNEVYDEELTELASDADSLFLVPGFSALKELNDSVTRQVCHSGKDNVNVPQYSRLCSDYSWADGLHPNPNDCSTYVDCQNFVTKLLNCDKGEAYDPILENCTDKNIAHPCNDPSYFGPIVTTVASVVETTKGPIIVDISHLCSNYNLADGNYPNPNFCNSFIECTALGINNQTCPEGLNFNTVIGVCDDVHNVDCSVNYNYFNKH